MLVKRLRSRYQDWCNDDLLRRQHCLSSPMQARVKIAGDSKRVFCSNNYLGLANHPLLRQAVVMSVERMGVGSGASQLVVGHTQAHRDAEQAFADFFGFEQALLFSTGYMANLGVIQALTTRDDIIYQDRLNHASLLDGARLSDAKLRRYHHRDLVHLQQQLDANRAVGSLVVTDAVFSMQGDVAPLSGLVDLRKRYGFALLVDDAHGVGVLGSGGRGSLSENGLSADDIDLLVCPMGKAFGAFGAMVLGKRELLDALRQFTRSYIYTTAMPSALAAVATASLQVLHNESWRVDHLRKLITHFQKIARQTELNFLPSATAIQSLLVGDAAAAQQLSERLLASGFLVTAIRYPTVPLGEARLRITLNVGHDVADIDALFQVLEELHVGV